MGSWTVATSALPIRYIPRTPRGGRCHVRLECIDGGATERFLEGFQQCLTWGHVEVA